MANQLRRLAVLTLALLATGGLVRMAKFGGRFKSPISMTTERTRRLEVVAAKHYDESKNQAGVTETDWHERAAHKVSGYRLGWRVFVSREQTNPERGIPGGPNSQHHPPSKKILNITHRERK